MYEVQLAIYDISSGMARKLSGQILGPNHIIEIIPHTAIIVYGKEYFFGLGIESADPNEFRRSRQIFPIEIQSLGHTSVSQVEFEAWCNQASVNGSYGPQDYDLLQRNCNNFAHDAATQGLRLSRGVPSWILDVPRLFLSSPLGQLMRPILEQMQVSNRAPISAMNSSSSSSSSSGNPFNIGDSIFSSATLNTADTPSIPFQNAISTTTGSNSSVYNPWLNFPSASTTPIQIPEPTEQPISSSQSSISPPLEPEILHQKNDEEIDDNTPPPSPIFDSYSQPLLSHDTNMVPICISKLVKSMTVKSDPSNLDILQKLQVELTRPKSTSNESINSNTVVSPQANWDEEILLQASQLLLSIIDNYYTTNSSNTTTTQSSSPSDIVFALMLLRLIVLHPTIGQQIDISKQIILKILIMEPYLLHERIAKQKILQSNAAIRSMVWCVLSNSFGTMVTSIMTTKNQSSKSSDNKSNMIHDWDQSFLQDIVDMATADLDPEYQNRVEIRQSSCAFLYNLVLLSNCKSYYYGTTTPTTDNNCNDEDDGKEEHLSDIIVSILSGAVTNLSNETDEVSKVRKLLCIGRIIWPIVIVQSNTTSSSSLMSTIQPAKELSLGLGFVDALIDLQGQQQQQEEQQQQQIKKSASDLAGELLALVSQGD